MVYKKLSKNTSMKPLLEKNPKAVVAVLVDWCPYCQELKENKTLKGVSKSGYLVIELDENHKETEKVKSYLKKKTYPVVGIFNKGKFTLLKEKDRNEEAIKKQLNV